MLDDVRSAPPPAPPAEAPATEVAQKKESAVEQAARKRFGLQRWDCPALYRETAAAATDADLAFWMVLILSGAIASLGLALNATAVVIGAMLIAPLLGPVLGLAMALAVGDGRLAIQTFVVIGLGTLGVIAMGAVLTLILPFQTVTEEILARTRPTTLDLAIAVASGLAGAVVTLSREKRLSASIPGVAIAVALIPPLGVAGFGIGTARWELVEGSMLLFGANLGGIVLSGMLAFLLIGMHRTDVVEAARRWHREGKRGWLAEQIERSSGLKRVRVFEAAWARVGLVLAFCFAVGIPLSTSLQAIVREARVEGAVAQAAAAFEEPGRLFVLGREVQIEETGTTVRLRVATDEWIGADRRNAFEREATLAAGERVRLDLEQVSAETEQLRTIAAGPNRALSAAPTKTPTSLLSDLDAALADAFAALSLPDDVVLLGPDVHFASTPPGLDVRYAAAEPLPPEAEVMLARQAARSLGFDPASVRAVAVLLEPQPLPMSPQASRSVAGMLRRHPELQATATADSAVADSARRALLDLGVPAGQVGLRATDEPGRLLLSVSDSLRTP